MRKGQNPAKFVKNVARPERITVALLNYIPFLSGFYTETLDVLKVCLESMRKEAGLPFDLMIFDNGSCAEVRDFLVKEKEEGRIQYLILAEKNMGKGGAWNVMLAGAPGEVIAYTDSDVLFSPKWLSRSVEILETFPNVGMVTARPFRTPPEFIESTLKWARDNAKLEEGQFIPWERLQFTAYKSTLQQFLPFDMDKPMGQVRQLDKRMNDSGLLRLMISDPLAMNMSNTLGYLRGELGKESVKVKSLKRRVLELGPIKRILLAVYNKIFNWYYS